MPKIQPIILLVILAMLLTSCTTAVIVRQPAPADFSGYNVYLDPPIYNPNSDEMWQVDLRSADLTKLDLSQSGKELSYADFDSHTLWPSTDKMPAGFDWQKIMETNKDPGLGIRELHEWGITGKGVGLAIIDQPLLVDHQEYVDQLRLYEETNIATGEHASMHGAAVTSIAAGKTVGVAPGVELYYIGSWPGDWDPVTKEFTYDFAYYAAAIRRVLEINQSLPKKHKIRVIAIQVGWRPDMKGYDDIMEAVDEATAQDVFVISSSLRDTHELHFQGLGRTPLSDPNDFWSYEPGMWWEHEFFKAGPLSNTLLVPMDSRTTASPTGTGDYVFYREGGWSWSIPYLAGTYALAVQVKPDITPEEFWEAALKTGQTIQIEHNGKEYKLGAILDPQALIEALQAK